MRYTYRNTITGAEFQTNCIVAGPNIERLEPATSAKEAEKPKVEPPKVEEPKAETKAPKKPAKRGTKK